MGVPCSGRSRWWSRHWGQVACSSSIPWGQLQRCWWHWLFIWHLAGDHGSLDMWVVTRGMVERERERTLQQVREQAPDGDSSHFSHLKNTLQVWSWTPDHDLISWRCDFALGSNLSLYPPTQAVAQVCSSSGVSLGVGAMGDMAQGGQQGQSSPGWELRVRGNVSQLLPTTKVKNIFKGYIVL